MVFIKLKAGKYMLGYFAGQKQELDSRFLVEQLVSQPLKFIPQRLPGCSPSFVCRSRCSAACPAGWDAVGTVSFPARVDVAETLELLIPVLIAEETFCFVLWEEKKPACPPVPFTGWEGNASRFVGDDAGVCIQPAQHRRPAVKTNK